MFSIRPEQSINQINDLKPVVRPSDLCYSNAMSRVGSWYSVQILVPRWAAVPADELIASARRWRPDIHVVHRQLDRLSLEIPTDDLPLHVVIFNAPLEAYAQELHDALTWSPTWHEP